eukprot:4731470-Alexandrium_andersonii.AAC.1
MPRFTGSLHAVTRQEPGTRARKASPSPAVQPSAPQVPFTSGPSRMRGECTCGGWYENGACDRGCPNPEGPARRYHRLTRELRLARRQMDAARAAASAPAESVAPPPPPSADQSDAVRPVPPPPSYPPPPLEHLQRP